MTRRPLADGQAQMLRRWVAGASDDRLESVMRGPLRRVLLWQIFRTMGRRFDAERGGRVEAVVEFRVGRPGPGPADRRQLVMAGGRCRAPRRRTDAPTLTLELDSVSFLRLVAGSTGAPWLLLRGKLRIGGDLLLAARLPGLLRIPRAPDERAS